jgi:hypothetical protein
MTLIRPFLRFAPCRPAPRGHSAHPTTCSSAERASAPRASHGVSCTSPRPIELPAAPTLTRHVYATAAENLERMRTEAVLMRDANPYYYAYRAT